MAQTELDKMRRGELFDAFAPDVVAARQRCKDACARFNNTGDVPRRRRVELWREIIQDKTPLPPPADDPAADEALFARDPWIEGPIWLQYGTNVRLGEGVYINYNCTILDNCAVTVGARTLIGPNVSLYGACHPLDPAVRDGTRGPEFGREIHIGEDCWIGGSVVILPGVTIGRGCTIGAGSVVTKDIPAFHVAVGNPARVIKKIETSMAG
ncbi:hypothetical protein VTN02DRAFT_2362 [Thermoascus thermophilus]